MNARYALRTPIRAGAIAAIDLVGDIDGALAALNIVPVRIGAASLRDLAGIDRGIVARWTDRACTLMPHGGIAVVRALGVALTDAGISSDEPKPLDAFPEAEDKLEALALRALTSAESPRAVDLLLDQPRRWRAWSSELSIDALRAHARPLHHLLCAPIVAAIGPTNIGKSTLLNALARREVSLAWDEPGVTRDHVGASLVLDGLAVRWLDTPGVRASDDPIETAAAELARHAARSADLILLCADARSGWLDPFTLGLARENQPMLRVALRTDLGEVPDADISISAIRDEGLSHLAADVRRALVPDEALHDPSPWLFDDAILSTLSFPTPSTRG